VTLRLGRGDATSDDSSGLFVLEPCIALTARLAKLDSILVLGGGAMLSVLIQLFSFFRTSHVSISEETNDFRVPFECLHLPGLLLL